MQKAEDAVLALAPPSPLPLTSLGQTLTFPEISQWWGEGPGQEKGLPTSEAYGEGLSDRVRWGPTWELMRDRAGAEGTQHLEARAGQATNCH